MRTQRCHRRIQVNGNSREKLYKTFLFARKRAGGGVGAAPGPGETRLLGARRRLPIADDGPLREAWDFDKAAEAPKGEVNEEDQAYEHLAGPWVDYLSQD